MEVRNTFSLFLMFTPQFRFHGVENAKLLAYNNVNKVVEVDISIYFRTTEDSNMVYIHTDTSAGCNYKDNIIIELKPFKNVYRQYMF